MKSSLIVISVLILHSCHDMVKIQGDDMKNTIESGERLKVEKLTNLTRNDIVGFKVPGFAEQKILRIVGLPGDTLVIDSSRVYINGELFKLPRSAKQIFLVYCKEPTDFDKLTEYDFSTYSLNYCFFSLDKAELKEIKNRRIVDSIYPIYLNKYAINTKVIQSSTSIFRNKDFLGPIYIPGKGEIITSDIVSTTHRFLNTDDVSKIIDDDYYFCLG